MSKPKTQDLEWLIYSLTAFNGSGYADMNSAEDFLDSYIDYKLMRNKKSAVRLANRHRETVLPMLEELLEKTYGAGRIPAQKNVERFQAFRKHQQSKLKLL